MPIVERHIYNLSIDEEGKIYNSVFIGCNNNEVYDLWSGQENLITGARVNFTFKDKGARGICNHFKGK